MIDILLSTYNGEKYIAEQIDSILAQDYQDWRLVMRDDCSTDNTRTILNDYAQRYPEKIILLPKDNKNLGAKDSFELLLKQYGKTSYVMFTDQDDIWLPNKVHRTLEVMQETEAKHPRKPIVVHCDAKIVDASLREIAPSFWKFANIRPDLVDHNKYFLAIGNSITGCAMMLNPEARKVALPSYYQAYMHDAWIGLSTLATGGVIVPIYESLLLYRQHGKNVLGAKAYHFSFWDWKTKYRLGKLCYRAAYPLVYNGLCQFLWKKIQFFCTRIFVPRPKHISQKAQ